MSEQIELHRCPSVDELHEECQQIRDLCGRKFRELNRIDGTTLAFLKKSKEHDQHFERLETILKKMDDRFKGLEELIGSIFHPNITKDSNKSSINQGFIDEERFTKKFCKHHGTTINYQLIF